MKKIFLTVLTAAICCLTTMAQEQKRRQSDEYRSTDTTDQLSEQRRDSTMQNMEQDTLSNEYRTDDQDTTQDTTGGEPGMEGNQYREDQDTTNQDEGLQSEQYRRDDQDTTTQDQSMESQQYRREDDADPQGNQNIQERTDLGDEGVPQEQGNVEDTTDQGNVDQADRNLPSGREDVDTTGRGMSATTDPATGKTPSEAGVSSSAQTHAVEVVEGKEGPEGQVVYKMNDEYFYVDQTKEKKIVKIDENELKDSKHKVTVKEGKQQKAYSKSKGKRSNKG